jgi:hypothetical protein
LSSSNATEKLEIIASLLEVLPSSVLQDRNVLSRVKYDELILRGGAMKFYEGD